MKQRFLNQKLGKRISRQTELQKAKLSGRPTVSRTRPGLQGRNLPPGKPA
jgi:hypothetical protein